MTPKLPQKKNFRQRAHCNPFSDHNLEYPPCPEMMHWQQHFPTFPERKVDFLDVGCGYGGLLIALSTAFPDSLSLGLEIRVKVTEYVRQRILALREKSNFLAYQNISVIRTNAMKFLPNFFEKGQFNKMFFLFPDPHFKKKKHKARIISSNLLSEYAFFLKEGGLIYVATDVQDLFNWMTEHLNEHPLFEALCEEEIQADPVSRLVLESTEEGHKVDRENRLKFIAIYKRIIPNPN